MPDSLISLKQNTTNLFFFVPVTGQENRLSPAVRLNQDGNEQIHIYI